MIVPELSKENRIDYDELATLTHLSLQGLLSYEIKISCSGLADELDISPQTASRRLQNLEESGLIIRERVSDGQFVTLTPRGYNLLEREYERYKELFSDHHSLQLMGSVSNGLGTSQHILTLDGYADQLERKLQYRLYPGTLNVTLKRPLGRRHTQLKHMDPIPIDSWANGDRHYAKLYCYPARLKSAADVTYTRTHLVTSPNLDCRDRTIELLAPIELRSEFGLTNGDELHVQVEGRK